MWSLFKLLVLLLCLAGFAWFGASVPLGNQTLFGHLSRIWHSEETQDLVDGAKEAAAPAVEKLGRGVARGVEEVQRDSVQAEPHKASP
jgi:hypothetical protein